MRTSDFYYDLPSELIAQSPSAVRGESRLLVYERENGLIRDRMFCDLIQYLRPGDVLARNTTRVIPARLRAYRADTGGAMEFLLLKRLDETHWECLARPGRRARAGVTFTVNSELSVTVCGETEAGGRVARMNFCGIWEEIFERSGETPLPPYITRRLKDKNRYQTVYARENGSAAAPTAGLHFTESYLEKLKNKGVKIADILLHVGLGTFRPVSADNIEDHRMHAEYYEVTSEAASVINGAKAAGGRLFAVGTTTTRTLESVADESGVIKPKSGWTDIFITPGYRFKAVDAQITNFHLPESTLLMLVSALCSREEIMRVYAHAVREQYRFFSFGDAMLVI